MKRFLLLAALMMAALALLMPTRGYGYLNLSPAGPGKSTSGPHQAINRCAMRVWADWRLGRGEFKLYKLPNQSLARPVLGRSFVNTGNIDIDMVEGLKRQTMQEWLQDAGYTADEPEIQQALRHFYDPLHPKDPWLFDTHKGLYNHAWTIGLYTIGDPEMDAITWATVGPAKNGQPANEFSWERGRDYMERAFYNSKSADEKDKLFAQGWRSVGETMHLVADMTVPAHVRNDGHAGKLPVGSLGVEPLEKRATDELIMSIYWNCAQRRSSAYYAVLDATGTDVISDIESAKDPRELMERVAKWTNHNFFSKDTVAGTLVTPQASGGDKRTVITPNNGRFYPSPLLQNCTVDKDFGNDDVGTMYKRTINFGQGGHGRDVYMARLSWTTEWWGWGRDVLRAGSEVLDAEVIESQASALIPTAIFACVRPIDMAMPRIEVQIENVDLKSRKFTGRVEHKVQGMYTRELRYNLPSAAGEWSRFAEVRLDGTAQRDKTFTMTIKDNKIEGEFAEGMNINGRNLTVAIDIGGLMVESEPFKMEDRTLKGWEERSGGRLVETFNYYDKPYNMPKAWSSGVLNAGWRPSRTYNIMENPVFTMANKAAGRHMDKVLHGQYRRYFDWNGDLAAEATYTYGNLNGPVRLYRPGGDEPTIKKGLYLEGAYVDNMPDGVWTMRDWDGSVEIVETWKRGELVSTVRPEKPKSK